MNQPPSRSRPAEGGSKSGYRFDVAASFASEDRPLVTEIVDALKEKGVRVFYDEDYQSDIWGKDLVEYLTKIYQHEAEYVLMFISSYYAEKSWTRRERRSALAKAIEVKGEYILPVRIDDTELDGVLPTIGYIDVRREGAQGIAALTLEKLGNPGETGDSAVVWEVPRTPAEIQAVLAIQPRGWEGLYFAGLLWDVIQRHKRRFWNAEIGLAKQRELMSDSFGAEYFMEIPTRYHSLISTFEPVFGPAQVEAAFGPPGVAGDPERIEQLSHMFESIYEEFLTISEDARGTVVTDNLYDLRDAAARLAVKPLEVMQNAVHEFCELVDAEAESLSKDGQPVLTLELKLELDSDVTHQFLAALEEISTHTLD